jgi:DNA-binding transcriptional LysR family regulator
MHTPLRDIEYFAAIAEHGQLQRAAAALGLSQPALSKSLRRLENTMHLKLLTRTPKGVELTSVGAALLSQVRRLRMTWDDIVRETLDLSEGRAGHLHIGTAPGFSSDLVPLSCAALLKEAPRATIRVTIGTADVLLPALARGEFDLTLTGVSRSSYENVTQERLFEDEFVVCASATHRLARKRRVALEDLTREQWVLAVGSGSLQRDIHQVFADNGLPTPKVSVETNSVPFRLHLLPGTNLLAFLPKRALQDSAARKQVVELPIKGLSYRRTVAVCYRKDAYLSPAARRLIEILRTTLT